jgi:hypothetical protein
MYPSINQNDTTKKTKHTKTIVITLSVVIIVLTFNLPLLHMLDTKRRLHNVSLPLSNQLVSMDSNGIGPSGTNISFTVNKNYSSSVEAKEDIIKHLEKAGLSILQPSDTPSSATLKYNGAKGKELPINELAMTFFPNHYAFTFYLQHTIPCAPDTTANNDDYVCGGELRNDALENKIVNSEPIRSVTIDAKVKLLK